MNTKFEKSRREFVKMMSGAMAAPFIAMPKVNAQSAGKAPLRFLTIVDTYGVPPSERANTWLPSAVGDYAIRPDDLGTILKPFEPYIDNMSLLSNMDSESMAKTNSATQHHTMAGHCLTGSAPDTTDRASEVIQKVRHPSIDVHIGNFLHNDYGLPAARILDHLFFTDYPHRNVGTMCYNLDGTQKRSVAGPANIRDTLFSGGSADVEGAASAEMQLAVLEMVKSRINVLSGSLKNANKEEVFAAYNASIDEIRREVDIRSESLFEIPTELAGFNNVANARNTATDTFNNIYYAFAYNMVSSITYTFGGEKVNDSTHSYLYDPSIADSDVQGLLNSGFHTASHLNTDASSKTHELIRVYQSEQLAILLERLSNTTDIDGSSVLDNTVVFSTSKIGNNVHRVSDYVHMIIAGNNTNLRGGFHLDCTGQSNNELFTTLAQGVTMPDVSFGGHDRSGTYLPELNRGPISRLLKS